MKICLVLLLRCFVVVWSSSERDRAKDVIVIVGASRPGATRQMVEVIKEQLRFEEKVKVHCVVQKRGSEFDQVIKLIPKKWATFSDWTQAVLTAIERPETHRLILGLEEKAPPSVAMTDPSVHGNGCDCARTEMNDHYFIDPTTEDSTEALIFTVDLIRGGTQLRKALTEKLYRVKSEKKNERHQVAKALETSCAKTINTPRQLQNMALIDAFYRQPLVDVTDARSTALALVLGYEHPSPARPWERAVGYQSRGHFGLDEARCMLAGKRLAFIGDSVTRYQYFIFNEFLATGTVKTHFNTKISKYGNGDRSEHYDNHSYWYGDGQSGQRASHQQFFEKSIIVNSDLCPESRGLTIETKFWFFIHWERISILAKTQVFPYLHRWAHAILYNTGWWELVGAPPGIKVADPRDESGFRAKYRAVLSDSFKYLAPSHSKGPVVFFRTSNCCGLHSNEDSDLTEEEQLRQAALAVYTFNEDAFDLIHSQYNKRINIFDIWPLVQPHNIGVCTFDHHHPNAHVYFVWTQLFLWHLAAHDRLFPRDSKTGNRLIDTLRKRNRKRLAEAAL